MATGTQDQQTAALGLDQSQIADAINRQKIGNWRQRNEMMRLGTSDPNAFALQNKQELQQAQQPSNYLPSGGLQSIVNVDQGQSTDINDYGYLRPDQVGKYDDLLKGQTGIDYQGGKLYTGKTAFDNAMSGGYLSNLYKNYGISDITARPWAETDYTSSNYTNELGITSTTQDAAPKDLNRILQSLKSGNAVDWNDYKNVLGYGPTHEIVPANAIANQLNGYVNTLYTSTDMRDLFSDVAKATGMSQSEMDKVAGTVAASMLKNAVNPNQTLQELPFNLGRSSYSGSEPFALGGDYTKNYLDATEQYLKDKTGGTLSDTFKQNILNSGSQIADYYRRAREVPAAHHGGFFGDILSGIQGLGDIVHKFDPLDDKLSQTAADALYGKDAKNGQARLAVSFLAAMFGGGWGGAAEGGAGAAAGEAAAEGAASSAASGAAAGAAGGGVWNTLGNIFNGINVGNSLENKDYAGALTGALGMTGNDLSSMISSQLPEGINPTVAKTVGSVGSGLATNLLRGMDAKNALASALFSSAAGQGGEYLAKTTAPMLGDIGSKMLGGAASGGLNSLFNKNDVVNGSLFGGMSGGLHGFLNSVGRGDEGALTPEQNIRNKQTAQNLTKLAKLFVRK